jgi:predicted dehydrogenase
VEVVALADPSDEQLLAVGGLLRVPPEVRFQHHADLLGVDLDLLLLATPPGLRLPIVADAAAAGVDVLCEKPLATTLALADELVDLCEAAGVRIFMCHNYAHFAEFSTAVSLVAEGAIGEVRAVMLEGLGANPWSGAVGYRPGWREDPWLSGGGRFIDTGIHIMYLMELFFGIQPSSVSADLLFAPASVVETHCFARYRFEAGVGVVNIGSGQGTARADVVGSRGHIHLRYSVGTGDLARAPERVFVVRDGHTHVEFDVPPRGLYTSAFYDDVVSRASGQNDRYIHSGRHGRHALELVLAAYASGTRGLPVALPITPEDPVYRQGFHAVRPAPDR